MNLDQAIELYIKRKQDAGFRFYSTARTLRAFLHKVGDVGLTQISLAQVKDFLDGPKTSPPTWRNKQGALRLFFEYWLRRGGVVTLPIPPNTPKCPQTFVPYIYSRSELRRLLEATPLSQSEKWCAMDAPTFRTLLLFLYATGLRLGEALRLECNDVNLETRLITIRGTKFYKSRLVPFGCDVQELLSRHLHWAGPQSPPSGHLFTTKKGAPIQIQTVDLSFKRLRRLAGISRQDVTTYQPRIHDLRHSFAVHRVTEWYRNGADLQRLLPVLSIYLGHSGLMGTQRYLTMTPELLQQANRRFEDYVWKGGRHDG